MTEYSKLEKSLKYWGALPEKAVMRLLGDHEFYYKMLKSFLASREFDDIENAIRKNDRHELFMAAHSLKGASATLGLVPLTNAISRVVEDVRPGSEIPERLDLDIENLRVEKLSLEKVMDEAEAAGKAEREETAEAGEKAEREETAEAGEKAEREETAEAAGKTEREETAEAADGN